MLFPLLSLSVVSFNALAVPVSESIGILRGRIIQGTEGGNPVEGLEAIVHIYDSNLEEQIAEYLASTEEDRTTFGERRVVMLSFNFNHPLLINS